MYQIAICDDEKEELDKMEQILRAYDKMPDKLLIKCFKNAADLISDVETKAFLPNIILLDIYLTDATGIETAKKLREMGNTGSIVFVTSSREHALEAFEVAACGYLVKPIGEKALFEAVERAMESLAAKQHHYVFMETKEQVRRVALSDIIYCEAQRKTQYVYLQSGESILLHMTMTKLCEMLCCYREFTRIGVSYVVNLEHIERLGTQMMYMDNGTKIYLPRGSYQSLRKKYFDYYFENETFHPIRTL